MKAALYIGDGRFDVTEREPVAPEPGQARVAVAYCGICGTDMHVFHGKMDRRVGRGRVIGHEMSGRVEAVGEGVDPALIGTDVVVRPLDPCGDCPACRAGNGHICHRLKFLGLDTDGAFQQSWTMRADILHRVPAGLSLRHAALVEPLAVACHDVRRARLVAGEQAVVIGGGPIGVLVALVAKSVGADVKILEINPGRRAIAAELGLSVIDPTAGLLSEAIDAWTGGKGAEVVFEVSGSAGGVETMTDIAATRGRIVMVAIHNDRRPLDLFRMFWRELELIGARVYEPQDFDAALTILAKGSIEADRIITDVMPLGEIELAFKALDTNAHALKILVEVAGGDAK